MQITGLGVIAEASIELDAGFTVVTGETGAGKTMIVTGLHLLSGGRADASRVRTGAEKAVVEGRFSVSGSAQAAKVADDAGAQEDEDGSVIAVRSVGAQGRSRAHLGGRSVPVAVLAELSEQMLAVHGQNDQLRLVRPSAQRAIVDGFAGADVAKPLAEYQKVRERWRTVVEELADRRSRSRELAQQADLLKHGLAEIADVNPEPGEDDALTARVKRLAEADDLREAAAVAQRSLMGADDGDPDNPGAAGLVAEAQRRLTGADDPELAALEPRLKQAQALLADVGAELGSYIENLDADPAQLDQLLARQAELKSLTRKYAADIDGVLAWAADAEAKLSTMDTSEEALAELAARAESLAKDLAGHATKLTKARKKAAKRMAEAITGELKGLAMGGASVEIAVEPRTAADGDDVALEVAGRQLHAGEHGVDTVELRLRAHPGAPALPVTKGASGGELSRVMLAIEVVAAEADPVPTMVFDEVDAGIGGRAAIEIGRRLAKLARSHQVIVVTHLPQVAAYADRHLTVHKGTDDGVTRSDVHALEDGERVAELARMLAGMDDTETGRAHAEELLATADADKASL